MQTSKYRAILFDFDGTLAPTLPLWRKAFHIGLRHFGIMLSDEDVVRRCFFRDWDEAAMELGVQSADALRAQVEIGLHEAFMEATLFPAALALIDHCRDHGLATALVTSAPRGLIHAVLPRLELDTRFDFVICADDVVNCKPHPEPLLTTLAALGREPSEAIMIGDSAVDVQAGKAAGTATALFLGADAHDFHSVSMLHQTAPDHIFSDHAEVPRLLGLPSMGAPS